MSCYPVMMPMYNPYFPISTEDIFYIKVILFIMVQLDFLLTVVN